MCYSLNSAQILALHLLNYNLLHKLLGSDHLHLRDNVGSSVTVPEFENRCSS